MDHAIHGTLEREMPKYRLNRKAYKHARSLIDAGKYVAESSWDEAQPTTADENAFLEKHSWDDYAKWFLGLTAGAKPDTKARYAFVYSDFKRVHRSGIIAVYFRAAQYRHKEIERAADRLLQYLDKKLPPPKR
jgi:hypothetical protein